MQAVDYFDYDPERGLLIRKSTGKVHKSNAKGTAYPKVRINNKFIAVHRIVYELYYGPIPEGFTVDHRDRNKLNYHHTNLRLATYGQQAYNTKPIGETSKYKGIYKCKKSGAYVARITYKGITHRLGSYKNELDAHKAYVKKAEELFGEFSVYNI